MRTISWPGKLTVHLISAMYNQHELPTISNTVTAITRNIPVSAQFYYLPNKCIINFLQEGKSFDKFKLVEITVEPHCTTTLLI